MTAINRRVDVGSGREPASRKKKRLDVIYNPIKWASHKRRLGVYNVSEKWNIMDKF